MTVRPLRNSLHIAWSVPAAVAGSRPADYHVVEYRTVGQWVPLTDRLSAGISSFNWTTASRGATYHFRVIAYYRAPLPDDDRRVGDAATDLPRRPVASIPSPIVTFHTGGTRAVSAVRYMALIPRDSFSRSILVTS